jgi:hypothetical protein
MGLVPVRARAEGRGDPEKYRRFSFQPDAEWERMYETILKNRPAGNACNSAMMMPPPGSGANTAATSNCGYAPPNILMGPRKCQAGWRSFCKNSPKKEKRG